MLHLPELAQTEALQVDDDERPVDMMTCHTRGRGHDFARQRLRVDDDGLPKPLRRDVLVQLGHVDSAEVVDIQRAAFVVSLVEPERPTLKDGGALGVLSPCVSIAKAHPYEEVYARRTGPTAGRAHRYRPPPHSSASSGSSPT